MITNTIHQYLYFTVFVMFFFIGIQQLIFRRKLQLNYFLAALFLAGGYNMLYFWMFSIGMIHKLPFLINTEIPASFLIGPCLYLYFTSLMGRVEIPAKSVLLHGLPFIISLVMVSVINVVDESIGSQFKNPATVIPDYTQNTVVLVINSLCDLSIAIYFLSAAIKTTATLLNQKMTKETKSVMFFLISFSLSSILLIMATLIRNPVLLQVSIILLSILPLIFIFFSFRNPDYAIKVIRETRQLKTAKAKNPPQNIEQVKAELSELMTERKFYLRTDLSLKKLSEELSITPHELSFILNSELNMNFNSYINSFRIEEAKSLLLEHKENSITQIAFDVGFNSTSSFYRYFLMETGVSPKDFQKSGAQNS